VATVSSRKRAALRRRKRFLRKKICRFCADKILLIDYKDVRRLRNLITERGKIIPRRISGKLCRPSTATLGRDQAGTPFGLDALYGRITRGL
jgi:ribosomal protein S18